ncbi:hypothetical protein L6R53_19065 [Myxococcota bacterium]|nr:hypothetical protein [Myxococcota bacterium]
MRPGPLPPAPALGLALGLAACVRVPEVLAPVAPAPAVAELVEVADPASAAAVLVGADPLLRRPRRPEDWVRLPGLEPVAAWAQVAARTQPLPADWWALERAWPGTLAVPLARGARLAELESLLAGGLRPEDTGHVVALLAPLADIERTGPADTRPALDWLVPGAAAPALAPAALAHAERTVLLGWLDGPDLPLRAPAQAMRPGVHDRLLTSPAGALLLARAQGATDPSAGQLGRERLALATYAALLAAGADTDADQARAVGQLASLAEDLRAAGVAVPDRRDGAELAALREAREQLTRDAATADSTGLALVASTGERLRGACPEGACRGLDRVGTLRRAATWGPQAAAAAATWRVIATKEALDSLEVTVERSTFGVGMPDLVDVLLAEGAGPVDLSLLRQRAAGPATWLALTRALGAPDTTDAAPAIAALRALLVRHCDEALGHPLPDRQAEQVRRIRDRAAR